MAIAQGDREFVGHLNAQASRLGETNVVRLSGFAAADKTGLACDKREVRLITNALLFRDQQLTRYFFALGLRLDASGRLLVRLA